MITFNDAFCSIDYERENVSFLAKYTTRGKLRIDTKYNLDRWVPNLQLLFHSRAANIVNHFSLGFFYALNSFNFKTKYHFEKQGESNSHSVTHVANGIIVNKPEGEIGIGTDLTYKFGDMNFNRALTYMWFKRENDSVILSHSLPTKELALGTVNVHLFKKISNQLRVAAELSHNFSSPGKKKIKFGLKYTQADNFTINAKINDKMKLESAFIIRLNKMVKLTVATNYCLDVGETTSQGIPFSVRIHLKD